MPRFGDETHTGRLGRRRDQDRVTLAARAQSQDGFIWWVRWLSDFAPEIRLAGQEPKSDLVLGVAERNPTAKRKLLDGVGPCRIFVMSIRENTNRILDGFRKIAPQLFTGRDPLQVLERLANQENSLLPLREYVYQLKQIALDESAVGRIEAFMNFDGGINRALMEAGLPSRESGRRFDRDAFLTMSMKELEEFSGRFAMIVADALSPEAQAAAIAEGLRGSSIFQSGAIAVRALAPPMTHDYLLDPASSVGITTAVEGAHRRIEHFLREGQWRRIVASLRTGVVEEEDSAKVRGIQVADVAAALASNMFERSEKPTREAARDLKDRFDGVFLNDVWL